MSTSFQFDYSDSRFPSLPLIDIEVSNFFGKTNNVFKGKIDTGADGTAIPEDLVKLLELKRTGKPVWILDANGGRKKRNTYDVYIKIGNFQFDLLNVTAMPRDNVLLGRNLINLWELKLNGQNQKGELTPWSTNPDDVK